MINFIIVFIICNIIFFIYMHFCKIWGISRFTRYFAPPRPAPWIFTFAPLQEMFKMFKRFIKCDGQTCKFLEVWWIHLACSPTKVYFPFGSIEAKAANKAVLAAPMYFSCRNPLQIRHRNRSPWTSNDAAAQLNHPYISPKHWGILQYQGTCSPRNDGHLQKKLYSRSLACSLFL